MYNQHFWSHFEEIVINVRKLDGTEILHGKVFLKSCFPPTTHRKVINRLCQKVLTFYSNSKAVSCINFLVFSN